MANDAPTTITTSDAALTGAVNPKPRLYIFDDKDDYLDKCAACYRDLGFDVASVLVLPEPELISDDLRYIGRRSYKAMRAIHSRDHLLQLLSEGPKPDAILTDGEMGEDCPIISKNPANGDSKNGSGLIEAARTFLPNAVCVLQSGSFYPDGVVKKSNGFNVVSKNDSPQLVAEYIHEQLKQARGNTVA